MYLPLIAIFVAISGTLGVSYMAESSSPGDTLYSIKTRVNDNFFGQYRNEPFPEEPLEGSSSGTSSDSLYLKASLGDSTAADGNSSSIEAETSLSASTSLTSTQVISAE